MTQYCNQCGGDWQYHGSSCVIKPAIVSSFHVETNSLVGNTTKMVGVPFCPDLIRYQDLGEADDVYGHVVRGFFWLLRWWR